MNFEWSRPPNTYDYNTRNLIFFFLPSQFVLQHANSAYSSSARVEARKFFVGGNWKCNGSVSKTNELISMLNQSTLTTDTEVVVCPSQIHLHSVQTGLRGDVAVGAQDVWTQGMVPLPVRPPPIC